MAKKDHTEKELFGDRTMIYDEHSKKVGHYLYEKLYGTDDQKERLGHRPCNPGGDAQMNNNGMLFFCRTYDFLHVFIPKEKSGSHHTAVTYRQGLKTFRNYVNSIAGIPTNRFEFRDCTYDFLLDYRNHLHEVDIRRML